MKVYEIQASQVPQFSKRDKVYLSDDNRFSEFINFEFSYKAIAQAIKKRRQFPVDRKLLKEVLKDQYVGSNISTLSQFHIERLTDENTFTIVTAHQPSLFTGPLYYIFKILSAIRLCQKLEHDYPSNTFVPVFIIGSEDHDFEEINHLHLYGKKVTWETSQTGSVGTFKTTGLQEAFNEFKDILGEKHALGDLLSDLEEILAKSQNYNEFSFSLTQKLFSKFGLVIIRMNDKRLKQAFAQHIATEVFQSPSKALVELTQEKLLKAGFDKQAFARDINFFYASEHGRNRIEKSIAGFTIVDTPIQFSEEEMRLEIENHPERFSPNVIMRPIYQESILPNLAYIGGGGELAYWMERKTQFEYFETFFPMLIRRNSAAFIFEKQLKPFLDLSFKIEDLLIEEHLIVSNYLQKSENPDFNLDTLKAEIEESYAKAEATITAIDQSLVKTAAAEKVKAIKSVEHLESKLKKALKQKEEVNINRIKKARSILIPNGLQERHSNIFEFMSRKGEGLISELLPYFDPFDKSLKIIVMQP